MITKTFKFLILVALFSAVSLSAQAVLAQTWQGPPVGTPPVCDASHPGCFTPINVGALPQTKNGSLGLLGRLLLTKISGVIELAAELTVGTQKELNAGKIAYQKWSTGLDIIGAGLTPGNRLVKIWDNLNVPGTTTTNVLVTNNICTTDGVCNAFNTGASYWVPNPADKTELVWTGRTGINGATDPTSSVDFAVGNNSTGLKGGTTLDLVTGGVKRLSVASNGVISIPVDKTLNLGTGIVGGTASSLTLTGVGSYPSRKVTILDSLFTTNLCTGTNSCVSVGDIINYITNPVSGYWTKVSGQSIVTTPYSVGIAGASPTSGLNLAITDNNTGIKVDSSTGLMSIFNGISRLTISSTGIISVPETKPIMYGTGSVAGLAASLDIKGVGVAGSRIVTVYDTLRTSNICTIDGSVCNSVTNIINNASSPWKLNGSNVYYTGGKVGVGLNNPVTELQVKGTVTSDNFLSRGQILVLDTSGAGGFLQSSGGSLDITGAGTGKYVTVKNNLSVINNLVVNNKIGVGGSTNPNSSLDIAIGNDVTGIASPVSDTLDFWTRGVKRLGITYDGQVQIPAGKPLCLGADCRTSWPTVGGAPAPTVYPTVIYCVFSPAGLITGSGCGWTGIDGWDGDNIAEDEAVMHCPASYKVTGGGVVCGKVGNMNRVEGTYQWDEDSWYVNCQSDLEVATISCIKTSD